MQARIRALVHAALAGDWFGPKGARLPVATLLFHFSLTATLCVIARGSLPPYAYGVFALSITLGLSSLPLLGELAPLLRADPSHEWIASQPVRPIELRISRVAVIAILLTTMTIGSAGAGALLAPAGVPLGGRLMLVVAAIAQTMFVAALLLWIQAALGERSEGVLVLLQTLLFCGILVGAALGLGWLPQLAEWSAPPERLMFYPPAWFATALIPLDQLEDELREVWISLAAVLVTAVTFTIAPFPPPPRARKTSSALANILSPFRALASKAWVRSSERGVFDFVYEALPAERDFVMRTYPLVAVPLAFLLLGADADDPRGEGLLAILLFAPATYLPILLAHVPATATPDARWILDTAPLSERDEREGAIKAIAIRFLLPLQMALTAVAWVQAGADFALRVSIPAAVVTLLALRALWPLCTERPPLSTSASDLGTAWRNDFTGILFVLATVTTIGAIATWRLVPTAAAGVGLGALAVVAELGLARRPRKETGE